MRTQEEIAVIEKIPLEGKKPFLLDDETHTALSLLPLAGKPVPREGEATVKILLGAPGSGKSRRAFLHLGDSVLISYDEGGAIYDIEGYKEKLLALAPAFEDQYGQVSKDTLRQRRELWLAHQADSQRIRSLTLRKALTDGHSLTIDTTSSSGGTGHLIKAMRNLSLREISMDATFAPFEISRDRIETRPRPTSGLGDLVGKRIGALEWMPVYAKQVDRFNFYYNPTNDAEPVLVLSLQDGMLTSFNARAVDEIVIDLISDRDHIQNYLLTVAADPSLVEPEDVTGLNVEKRVAAYEKASNFVINFLHDMGLNYDVNASPNLRPA